MMNIGLLLENNDLRHRIETALSQLSAKLRVIPAGADQACDVLVTDRPPAPLADTPPASTPPTAEAVIALGWNGPADVALPLDATPREIATSCLLLGEIVQLRRAQRAEQLQGKVLWELAHRDPLTGVPNRRAWELEFPRRLRASQQGERPLVLVLLDLDRFKTANDEAGHLRGDQLLQGAAEALTRSVRATDFVARLGGDEFAALLGDCTAPEEVLERIRRSIQTICQARTDLAITASIGYSLARADDTVETLFDRADAALRAAKASGRDRVSGR